MISALLLGAALIAPTLASSVTSPLQTQIRRAIENTTDNWVVSNGDPSQLSATAIAGGVQIGNLHAYSSEMRTTEKVTLDGMTFTFQNVGDCTSSNIATGFYFSQETGFNWSAPAFVIWHALYPGQSRLVVGANHDYNASSIAHTSPSMDAATGFGVADNMVMNSLNNDGFTIRFEHASYSWWKVTITEIFASSFWGSNANYVKADGETYASVTTYLNNSNMPIDENGAAYLHVVGAGNGGTVSVTDFTDGTFKEVPEDDATADEIAAAKAKIDAIDVTEYPDSLAESIAKIKATAVTNMDAATKPSELQTIIDTAKADIKALYGTYAGYDLALEANDPGCNFNPCWDAAIYGNRFNDEGGVSLNLLTSYGIRGQMIRKYDLTSFSVTINLGNIVKNSVVFLNFDANDGSYITEGSKYFHLEFLKVSDNAYCAVFGTTSAHNISITDWGIEASGDYTGRIITTSSGTMNISMATDFATNKSTLSINGASLNFDSSIINKGITPTKGINAYVQVGGINSDTHQRVLIETFQDSASKTYAKGLPDAVAALKNTIEATKSNLLATVPTDGLDDAGYATYKTAAETAATTINGDGGLTSYDYAHYKIASLANAAIEAITAPLSTYDAELVQAKEDAKTIINAYDETKYRDNEKAALAQAKEEGITAVENATTLNGVKEALATAKAALDAIKTDAQLTAEDLANAKTGAIAELNSYVDKADYRDDEKTKIDTIISEGTTAINAATTRDEINTALTAAEAKLDALKTDASLTAEELATAKTGAKATLSSYVKESDYREAEVAQLKTIISEGDAAIDAAATETGVTFALASAEAKIDALKTGAEYEAEEAAAALKTAKENAISELEAYVKDRAKYSEENLAKIDEAIVSAKAAINAATTIDGVNAALAAGKTALDAIPQKSGGCGGSIVGTASLAAGLGLLTIVLAIRRKRKEN